jgi:hypothetical protein
MHTKHTNAPQGSWITCKNTIEMENGTFRGAGLRVKTRYKWKTDNCSSAYLCSETSLFDDFNTKTFQSIVKNVKKTRRENTIKHDTFGLRADNGGYPLLLALLHGKKHSPSPVVGWLAGWVGGLAGWVGWLGWLAGLAGWDGWLGWMGWLGWLVGWLAGWLAGLAGWLGWLGWVGWVGWLVGWLAGWVGWLAGYRNIGFDTFIYFHIPLYTFIYLPYTSCTFIYPHMLENLQYKKK